LQKALLLTIMPELRLHYNELKAYISDIYQNQLLKRTIRKWTMRLTVTGALLVLLLLGILLNPSILYAHSTQVANYSVYHQKELDPHFLLRLTKCNELLQASELHDSDYQMDLCLDDGSLYPALMKALRGLAFAWGFSNKIVLQGVSNAETNKQELNGYYWNLEQLLAHEAIHCYQYHSFGLWNSNPIAGHPDWKWEGYREYISRQSEDQGDLCNNLKQLLNCHEEEWFVAFKDGTIAPKNYFADWLLVTYAMDVKGFNFHELIKDSTDKESFETEMWQWYKKQE